MFRKVTISKGIMAVMAAILSFTFTTTFTFGAGVFIKESKTVVEKPGSSHSSSDTQLPYEGKEKEVENRLEESKGNSFLIHLTDNFCCIFVARVTWHYHVTAQHHPGIVNGVPVYLFIRSLLI